MKPGLLFLELGHDADCPGRFTDGEGCTCSPTVAMHDDVQRYIRGELVNRAARHTAARAAAKAMRKAARGGRA